ncbi:putative DNA-binding domain-containing protein [Pseudooceanicola sp. MF1-13]|uniref:HvfC/BufC family peptide modification chaperone n=1 Tax=Pseudooceanicola sp. MF1-13 TaxID=3379095 RepID=UPI00389297BE
MLTDQTTFRRALLNPTAATPSSLTDGAGGPAGRRFAVYRNNVAVSLTEALITGFPVCHRLMGDDIFRAMAGAYLRAHPPESPLMMQFGQKLPKFMEASAPLQSMRWIADVARLELALRSSYHAADCVALGVADLAAIPSEELPDRRFALAPALRILRSEWPVLTFWSSEELADDLRQGDSQDVLITRVDFDPHPHLLSPGDTGFLAALKAGEPLGSAAEVASAAHPDHDPTAILTLLMQTGSLTTFEGDT